MILFRAAFLCIPLLTAVAISAQEARPHRGQASLGLMALHLAASDSSWTRVTQQGAYLRLGYWITPASWPLEVVPHIYVGATSIGGVDRGDPFALAEGELGLQVRPRVEHRLRPYAAIRLPLWHTTEVERGPERRNYAIAGGSALPTLSAGVEAALLPFGSGLDVGISYARGTSRSLELFDASQPQGHWRRFRWEPVIEEYRVWRVHVGYSGGFDPASPFCPFICF